jgi:hypothetical protein
MRGLQLYQALHELESMFAERCGQATSLLRVDVQHQTGTRDAADGSTELSRGPTGRPFLNTAPGADVEDWGHWFPSPITAR